MGLEVAAGVFVASTLYGAHEAKKREARVEKAEDERARSESAIRAEEARVARRQQIREARVKQAQIENQALASGQQSSSAATAAGGSLQTQAATNIGSIAFALQKGDIQSDAATKVRQAGQKSDLERAAGVTQSVSSIFIK